MYNIYIYVYIYIYMILYIPCILCLHSDSWNSWFGKWALAKCSLEGGISQEYSFNGADLRPPWNDWATEATEATGVEVLISRRWVWNMDHHGSTMICSLVATPFQQPAASSQGLDFRCISLLWPDFGSTKAVSGSDCTGVSGVVEF